jgi:hypothetical protein
MSRLRRLFSPESRDHQELRLELPPDRAREACLAVAAELDWRAESNGDERRITILEDFTKLHCGDSPIRMEIELRPEASGRRTTVDLEAIVAGVGGVSNKHLHEGVKVYSVLLGRRAKALGG